MTPLRKEVSWLCDSFIQTAVTFSNFIERDAGRKIMNKRKKRKKEKNREFVILNANTIWKMLARVHSLTRNGNWIVKSGHKNRKQFCDVKMQFTYEIWLLKVAAQTVDPVENWQNVNFRELNWKIDWACKSGYAGNEGARDFDCERCLYMQEFSGWLSSLVLRDTFFFLCDATNIHPVARGFQLDNKNHSNVSMREDTKANNSIIMWFKSAFSDIYDVWKHFYFR